MENSLSRSLAARLTQMRKRNPRFSVRALARKLNLQPSATNEILKGKRRVSRKLAERITDQLQLSPTERHEILRDFEKKGPVRNRLKSVETEVSESVFLSSAEFKKMAKWTHLATLSLLETKDSVLDPLWISKKLNINKVEADATLETLTDLGLIRKRGNGPLFTLQSSDVSTTDDLLTEVIQANHLQDMELAAEKLKNVPVLLRDFSSYTFPANPAKMKRAKEIIRQAQEDLESLMHDETSTEVYRYCSYLFPLTTPEQK